MRRGIQDSLYSDNATNFQVAKYEISDPHALLNFIDHKNSVNRFSKEKNIKFHFIPLSALHFCRLWEASVIS